MSELIRKLAERSGFNYIGGQLYGELWYSGKGGMTEVELSKFAKLIVKECANAADAAREAYCKYPGDYVVEQMGYGVEEGAANWRANNE